MKPVNLSTNITLYKAHGFSKYLDSVYLIENHFFKNFYSSGNEFIHSRQSIGLKEETVASLLF